MRQTWTFHSAGQIVFGPDAALQIGDIALRLGLHRVLIVTDPILERAGILERVWQPLLSSGIVVDAFTGGEPEPSMRAAQTMSGTGAAFQARRHGRSGRRQ